MIDNSNKTPTGSIINQRRKSSPECFFPFKSTTSSAQFLLQKQESNKWIQSRKQSIKDVFHHNKNNNNETSSSLPATPSSSSLSPHPLSTTTTKFLRSFSLDISSPSSPPAFSSISSSNSYFSSSSYTNSITLPAAPTFSGANSSYSSLKNKKRRSLLLRTSSTSDSLYQDSLKDPKMIMTLTAPDTPPATNRNSSASSDIELATEIGQGLLSEVRRMQSILQERQDSLIALEHERSENQQRMDDLIKQLRYKSEVEERLKQDIWDLELTKQDLSHQIRQLSQSIAKTQMEQVRRERQSSLVVQELELLKASQLNWQEMMTKTQNDYENTISQLNEQLLKLRKEKDCIALQLEELNCQQRTNKFSEEEYKQRKMSEQEIKTLKISLVQAHTELEHLQLDLKKEKQLKNEVDALLRESQETIELMQQQQSTSPVASIKDMESSSLEHEIESAESRIQVEPYGSIVMTEAEVKTPSQTTMEGVPVHPLAPAKNGFEKVLPFVMHTMIGEWMLKFTRNRVGNGISNKSHQRFFWMHPYTKTLYWSEQEPGVKSGEFKAKSVSMDSFCVVGQVIIIKSSARDIHIQCIQKESHEKWVKSLQELITNETSLTSSSDTTICAPQPRANRASIIAKKSNRLSLLLESKPPSTTVRNKWGLSEANFAEEKQASSIRFGSIRFSSNM